MTRTPAVAARTAGYSKTIPVRQAARKTPSWRSVNITMAERAGRVAIGLATIAAGTTLIASASAVAVVLENLLIAAGLDLTITGTLGHCLLYAKLGHMPRSLQETR